MLGLLTAVAAALRIPLQADEALAALGWSGVPIALRAFMTLLGARIEGLSFLRMLTEAGRLPAAAYWLRPFDIFEVSAVMILGFLASRRPGVSIQKALLASVLILAAWSLAARGYFRPF